MNPELKWFNFTRIIHMRISLWDTDRTGLPAACESLIVLYMTARDRANGDASAQKGATLRLSLYEAQKRRLRMDFDEPPVCRLCSYW